MIHVAAMTRRRRTFAGPAGVGRDNRTHAHVLTGDAMIGFRIVPGVGNDDPHVGPSPGIEQDRLKMFRVTAAAGGGAGREDQITELATANDNLGRRLTTRKRRRFVWIFNCFARLLRAVSRQRFSKCRLTWRDSNRLLSIASGFSGP